jgi:hypothetical protein
MYRKKVWLDSKPVQHWKPFVYIYAHLFVPSQIGPLSPLPWCTGSLLRAKASALHAGLTRALPYHDSNHRWVIVAPLDVDTA